MALACAARLPSHFDAMDTHDPFLAAIRAAPADRTARLVYADWLEERGDPRFELVRVCEAMRDEPVWSDRYWQLKARRNQLWGRFPIAWLEATGYDGSYYDPVFRDGVPDDPRGRWRLIREFAERWHGVAAPDAGGRDAEVAEVERRLGLPLPESVREFVAFAHDLNDPGTRPRDTPWPPFLFHCAYTQFEHLPEHDALSLIYYTLDDGVLAVLDEDLGLPDPPTYHVSRHWADDVDYDEDGQPTPRFESPAFSGPSVSRSVFRGLFLELPSAGEMSTTRHDTNELLGRLGTDFPVHAKFDDGDVFEGDEMLVFVDGPRPRHGGPPVRYATAIVRRPIPVESVPAYLFGTDDRDTMSSGMLGPAWFRRQQAEAARRPDYRPPPRWASILRRREAVGAGRDPWENPLPPPELPRYEGGDEIPF